MALANPFQDVLGGLLDDLFSKKGINSPFSRQIREMQDDIEQRITDPAQSRIDAVRTLANQKETAPRFSPQPQVRPDPNAGPPAIRDPRFRPNLPENPLGQIFESQSTAQAPVRVAQAGSLSHAPAAPVKPLQASKELVDAVIQQESGGNAQALSPKGAIGLMQIMPTTALDPGFGVAPIPVEKLTNAAANKKFGTDFLSAMLNRYNGDTRRALVAFNAGPGFADQWDGNVTTLPAETQTYVAKIEADLGVKEAPAVSGPETPATAPSPQPAVPASPAPSAGQAVAPSRPQRPKPAAPPSDPLIGPPTLASAPAPAAPRINMLQAVTEFLSAKNPKAISSVSQTNLLAVLALMGKSARKRS